MPLPKASPESDSVRCLDLADFDLRLERYRIVQPKADLLLARLLSKYGQLAPVVSTRLASCDTVMDQFAFHFRRKMLKRRFRHASTTSPDSGAQKAFCE